MILLISTCSEKLNEEEFVRSISKIIEKDVSINHYSSINKADLDKASKVIICGTSLKDNEYLKHLKEFDWLKSIEKPVLGICSGMQVIALQFGAKLIKNKEIGMTSIRVIKPNPLFSHDFKAYELHGKGLADLDNFEILATSTYSVQAIKHNSREIYGIMFHPEVRNEQIVKNFLSLCQEHLTKTPYFSMGSCS